MSYWKLSEEAMNKRLSNILLLRKEMMGNVDKLHVSISTGNSKLGAIPSVSLIPVLDCANCSACGHSCYDLRHDLIYKAGRIARVKNNLIYTCDPQRYFREIKAWLTLNFPRAFRWHIGGDIKDVFYYHQMIHIAKTFPDIKFLCFTKRFNLVNQEYAKGNIAPDNLRLYSRDGKVRRCLTHMVFLLHILYSQTVQHLPTMVRNSVRATVRNVFMKRGYVGLSAIMKR